MFKGNKEIIDVPFQKFMYKCYSNDFSVMNNFYNFLATVYALQNYLGLELDIYNNKRVVSGGFFVNFFTDNYHGGDIDIYTNDPQGDLSHLDEYSFVNDSFGNFIINMDNMQKYAATLEFESVFSVNDSHDSGNFDMYGNLLFGKKVQIVTYLSLCTIHELFENFDLSVCRFATDGKRLVFHKRAFKDFHSGFFDKTYNNNDNKKKKSLNRARTRKYIQKGLEPTSETLRRILDYEI